MTIGRLNLASGQKVCDALYIIVLGGAPGVLKVEALLLILVGRE